MNNNEIILYASGELSINVNVDKVNDTVWLSQEQMAELFSVNRQAVTKHISNIYKCAELEKFSTCSTMEQVQNEGDRQVIRRIKYYALDMIISVGYRVNTKSGITFRKWANQVLKDYLVKGYAINQKRIDYLEKQVKIISIAARTETANDNEKAGIFKVITDYKRALDLLDCYDHQSIVKPEGSVSSYVLSYVECRDIIDSLGEESSIFGVEKDESFNSSINAIYQTACGEEVYISTEEKAANLLYFIVKNHSFLDGNKRIAAIMFLYFLEKNYSLYLDGDKVVADETLVAITIMIAESKTDEKAILIDLIMNLMLKK